MSREERAAFAKLLALHQAKDRLEAVHALVDRYRAVSPSTSQQMYLRDLERALGLDLAPVTDRDGRTDW